MSEMTIVQIDVPTLPSLLQQLPLQQVNVLVNAQIEDPNPPARVGIWGLQRALVPPMCVLHLAVAVEEVWPGTVATRGNEWPTLRPRSTATRRMTANRSTSNATARGRAEANDHGQARGQRLGVEANGRGEDANDHGGLANDHDAAAIGHGREDRRGGAEANDRDEARGHGEKLDAEEVIVDDEVNDHG